MRTGRMARLMIVGLATAVIATGGQRSAGVFVGPRVQVLGGDAEHLQLVRWAVGRFEDAGLDEPVVDVRFDFGPSTLCHGGLGWASGGNVDLCAGRGINLMTRHLLLHEMSHIWLDQNLSPWSRALFLRMRGLRSWNSADVPWDLRGYEQGAEILSWELGGRILAPTIPDNAPGTIDRAYALLTGGPPPER
jgi:hypothetical protein